MEEVTGFDELWGVWTLAYVSYPTNKGVCFAYPQYAFTRVGVKRIPAAILPDVGAIGVGITGRRPGYAGASYDGSWVESEYGGVVALRINAREDLVNPQYEPNAGMSFHFGQLNLGLAPGQSAIEFQKLFATPQTKDLLEVVELEGTYDLSRPLHAPVGLRGPDERIFSPRVAVEQVERGRIAYYGPFEWQRAADGLVRLSAVDAQGKYVLRLDAEDAPAIFQVLDMFGSGTAAARFIDGRPFTSGRGQGRKLDWVSDQELIEKVAQGLKSAKRLKSGLSSKDFAAALQGCRLEGIYAARRERIAGLVELPQYWESLGDTLSSVMRRPEMEGYVMRIAQSDRFFPLLKDKLVDTDEIKREMDRAEAEAGRALKERREELARVEDKLAETRGELANVEETCEAAKDRILAGARAKLAGLEDDIARKRDELAQVESDVANALERQSRARALMEGMLSDREALAANLLRDTVLRSAMEQSARTACADPADDSGVIDIRVAVSPDADALDDAHLAERVRDDLADRAGRDLTVEETANLLTCMVQGPVTVLSGPPGTGKTSLVRVLAGALGLTDGARRRFVEVGVERGWTSHHDWVGYFNSIVGAYEKSDPMVFDAVVGLDREANDPAPHAPFLFLLDEMDLSPVEHYWAPFLRTCDTHADKGSWVDLGGRRRLHVPPHARFMATVHFDHTTEALSPRLLDRAWVVRLDTSEVDLDDDPVPVAPDFSGVGAFSWGRLVQAFGATGKGIPAPLRGALDQILHVLSSHGMPASHRSVGMVRGYLEAMSRYVNADDPEARLSVLDRACAQKLLPLVSMPACAAAESLLEELKGECASLPMSLAIVERMSETGAEDGFYSFFS